MIKINLLSPLDKENLKWEKINNLLGQSIFAVFVAEAFFVAVFFFCMEYLKMEEGIVNADLSAINVQENTREVAKMEAGLKQLSGKIDAIDSIQQNHLGWSSLVEDIADMIPEGVKLESVSSYKEAVVVDPKAKPVEPVEERYVIAIAGNAKTREGLLELEDNLKKSELFTGLEYDDANYVESKDINFHYQFYITKEKLSK